MKITLSICLAALILTTTACKDPGEGAPRAEVQDVPARPAFSPPAKAPGAEGLALSPANSEIAFVGAKVSMQHDGGFKEFAGEIQLDAQKTELSRVWVEIDARSVWADNERLTRHLRSPDFFDVERFPRAAFVTTKVEPAGAAGAYNLTGDLDLHGVVKSITFPATVTVSASAVQATAEFVINRHDWQISHRGKPDDLINDNVRIKLTINAPRVPGAPSAANP